MHCRLLLPTAYCLLLLPTVAAAQCDQKEYDRIFSEAQQLQVAGRFIEAKNTYEAAKVYACSAKDRNAAEEKIDALFRQINILRSQADSAAEANRRTALNAYAKDLAYKSRTALREGDRNTAFRLAEFACSYVDGGNTDVIQALADALYFNRPGHPFLPRSECLQAHLTWSVNTVAYSPDGSMLATGSYDNTIKIWDTWNGTVVRTLKGHTLEVNAVSFSPDGKSLASGSSDKTVKIWDLKTGVTTETISFSGYISNVTFSPDGKKLAISSLETAIKIWDVESKKITLVLEGHSKLVRKVAFSPDGRTLASCSLDATVKLWDARSGSLISTLPSVSQVRCVAFSPDGNSLATASSDKTASIWDWKNGRRLVTLSGHTDAVAAVAFSPDGRKITTCSDDFTAKVWEPLTGTLLTTLCGHAHGLRCAVFSPDGRKIATGSYDNTFRIWDLQPDPALPVLAGHSGQVTTLTYAPDGKTLVSGAYDQHAIIWDPESGDNLATIPGFNHLACSPDGSKIATQVNNGKVAIWNLSHYDKPLAILPGHGQPLTGLAYSPDGKTLATCAVDRVVKIWDTETGRLVADLEGDTPAIKCVAYSGDGSKVLAGGFDGSVRAWDRSGKALWRIVEQATVNSVACSPDGKTLATAPQDGTAKIRDLQNGKLLTTLDARTDIINHIAYSPDGKMLAAGYDDNHIRVWEPHTGKLLLDLQGDTSPVWCVAFRPDGRQLAYGCVNHSIGIGELGGEGLIHRWQTTGPQAPLLLPQLQQYNLESLLDLHPDNEQKLIATRETWQIKAFADLAAAQAAGSNVLARVEPHFARADRLYAAALALHDEPLIRQDYAALLRRWAEVCAAEGLASRAAELKKEAGELWKE